MKIKLTADKIILFVIGVCLLIYVFACMLSGPFFQESLVDQNLYDPKNASFTGEAGSTIPYPTGSGTGTGTGSGTQSIKDAIEAANAESVSRIANGPAAQPSVSTSPLDSTMDQYAIYASHNAAYDGTATSLEQLANVMARGVRWIHLNVAYIIPPPMDDKSVGAMQQSNEKLWVVFASTPKDASAPKTLPLSTALKYINTFAFAIDPAALSRVQTQNLTTGQKLLGKKTSTNGCSIQQDAIKQPLFVHITASSPNVCTNWNTDIFATLYTEYLNTSNNNGLVSKSKLYQDTLGNAIPITAKTELADIQETIQFSFDINNMVSYYTTTGDANKIYPDDLPKRALIQKSFNIKTGGNTLASQNNYTTVLSMQKTPIIVNDNSTYVSFPSTMLNTWNIAFPATTDTDNPDSYTFTSSYGMNVVPHRFYISGKNLDKYNDMFTNGCTPLLPLTTAVRYINKQNLLANP